MKNRTKILFFGLLFLLLISSCCNKEDNYYWLPQETLRYYQDNDTIRFLNPETSHTEVYVVCDRNSGMINRPQNEGGWCMWEDWFEIEEYYLRRDLCTNSRLFLTSATAENNGDIAIEIYSDYGDSRYDLFGGSYNNSKKSDIEIMGFTYEKTINFNPDPVDRLANVIFSLEYGIVQYQFDSLTFSLINY